MVVCEICGRPIRPQEDSTYLNISLNGDGCHTKCMKDFLSQLPPKKGVNGYNLRMTIFDLIEDYCTEDTPNDLNIYGEEAKQLGPGEDY